LDTVTTVCLVPHARCDWQTWCRKRSLGLCGCALQRICTLCLVVLCNSFVFVATLSVLSLGMVVAIDVSVVIPSNNGHTELLNIVQAVCSQTIRPAEIVIVDSSVELFSCSSEVSELCANSSIKLKFEVSSSVLKPGHARNVGIKLANGNLIALIDVKTIPRLNWLENSLKLIENSSAPGVWGSTCFSAETLQERLIRDCFFGILPRTTLPGSLFKREVFEKTGEFIDWVRAGEDTEWMLRLNLLKIPFIYSKDANIDYVGLIGLSMMDLIKKWYRNYKASRELPHFYPQKVMLWLILYPLLILLAFNWNYLIADWRTDSPFYIGHITKIAAGMPIFLYVLFRGILLPLKRGVGIWNVLPTRFLAITLICLMADFVKFFVFSSPFRELDSSATHGE
jgi:hypothetical protein